MTLKDDANQETKTPWTRINAGERGSKTKLIGAIVQPHLVMRWRSQNPHCGSMGAEANIGFAGGCAGEHPCAA